MGQINTNNYPTVDSLADADLLIVENAIHGTGTTTPKQLRENAIGTDTLETTAQTVTGAINELKNEMSGAGHTLAGVGSKIAYNTSTHVIDSDIILHRAPKGMDRVLLFLDAKVNGPYSLTVYGESYSDPYTIDVSRGSVWEPLEYLNGLCILEYHESDEFFVLINMYEAVRSNNGAVSVGSLQASGNISAGGNLTAAGNVLDGHGNDLASVAALELSASGNPIIVNAQPVDAKELSVELEPIQDLHGYDKPWAGGAGKNKFDTTEISDVGNSYRTKEFTLKANTTYTISTDLPKNNNNSANLFFFLPSGSADTSINGVWNGQTRTLTTGADGKFIIGYRTIDYTDTSASWYLSHNIQIEEGSTPTSYEPYTNICPISGRTETSVTRKGKNRFVFYANEAINANGTFASSGTYARTDYLKINSSVVSFGSVNGHSFSAVQIGFYNAEKGFISRQSISSVSKIEDITVPSNAYYFVFAVIDSANITAELCSTYQLQAVESNTLGTYEPYTSEDFTIQLGQTVYGARIDFKTGVGTITKALVDLGTLNWVAEQGSSSYIRMFSTDIQSLVKPPLSGGDVADMICSIYDAVSSNATYAGTEGISIQTTGNIAIYDSDYTDAAAFTTAMSGVQLCYELATPITIQLTPSMLELLKGYNYITGDGEMGLVYIPESILPTAPTTDGNYKLRCTVTNGQPSFSWVSDT